MSSRAFLFHHLISGHASAPPTLLWFSTSAAAKSTRPGPGVIPTAQWHKPETYMEWVPSLPTDRPIVLACRYGHNLSQMIAAELRARGVSAQVLEGGRKAWSEAGLPLVTKATLERFAPKSPSLWVTRRRPKIDRVACPWLIRRFIDPPGAHLLCRSR